MSRAHCSACSSSSARHHQCAIPPNGKRSGCQCFSVLPVSSNSTLQSFLSSTYHNAVGALVPLLVTSVSVQVRIARFFSSTSVVDLLSASLVDADTGKVEVGSNERAQQDDKSREGGGEVHGCGVKRLRL